MPRLERGDMGAVRPRPVAQEVDPPLGHPLALGRADAPVEAVEGDARADDLVGGARPGRHGRPGDRAADVEGRRDVVLSAPRRRPRGPTWRKSCTENRPGSAAGLQLQAHGWAALVASGLPAQATPLLGREREAAMLAARGR
jgi:hypothetical protein